MPGEVRLKSLVADEDTLDDAAVAIDAKDFFAFGDSVVGKGHLRSSRLVVDEVPAEPCRVFRRHSNQNWGVASADSC